MNKIWILENGFSQEWDFSPACFFKCSNEHNREQKRMLDRYAVETAGEEPARYGYVKIEGQGNVDCPDTGIVIAADSDSVLNFIYQAVCDSFLLTPGVIDLRHIDCRVI